MSVIYDNTELAAEADEKIRTFQADAAKRAGIFHHLITLPTYHTAALSTDNHAKEYFGRAGMLGYVQNIRSEEHTSELKSLMRLCTAVFCLKKKKMTLIIKLHNCTTHIL